MLHTTSAPRHSQSRGNGIAGLDPNVPSRSQSIVTGGGSPKPFMWARPTSNAGERPSSRNPDQPDFTTSDGTRLPRPPPTAAFGSRPMARQKPMSMSLDLFDLQSRLNTPASRGAPKRQNSTTGRLGLAAADEFEMPAPQARASAAQIPIIVEDSWGDLALPPVNRTVAISSGRRSKPSQQQQHQHSAAGSPLSGMEPMPMARR